MSFPSTTSPRARIKMVHAAIGQPNPRLFTPTFRRELSRLGELEFINNAGERDEEDTLRAMQQADVLLTGWGGVQLPSALATQPGNVRYVCNLTGSIAGLVPVEIVRSGLPVTNWGNAAAFPVAEGALALLLAILKQLPDHGAVKREGGWRPSGEERIGSLRDLRLGLYGYGAIGRLFHELCRPLRPKVSIYDPFVADLPTDATVVTNLGELFATSDAVMVHAALTEKTERSITSELLAKLPDGGILVNIARGEIVDQEALFAELASGRLRAALDVLAGDDRLPPAHPARQWPNLILSGHLVHGGFWPHHPERLDLWHRVALDNLQRFQQNQPLKFLLSEEQLSRST